MDLLDGFFDTIIDPYQKRRELLLIDAYNLIVLPTMTLELEFMILVPSCLSLLLLC